MVAFEETQTLSVLDVEEGTAAPPCTISALRAGKPLVLDLWHTKCVRCPDALTKLDGIAGSGKHADVVFASCALSLCDKPRAAPHASLHYRARKSRTQRRRARPAPSTCVAAAASLPSRRCSHLHHLM